MRDKQQIEAMYYLSPLQQGLLFHRLADATADPYFYQYAYRLQGDLRLDVKKDAINRLVPNPGGGFVPQLDKREITTSVLVDNGQTVVLGGVYEVEKRDDLTKVPFLGDVPILGNLFKKTGRTDTKAELLIFVTPRILSESLK